MHVCVCVGGEVSAAGGSSIIFTLGFILFRMTAHGSASTVHHHHHLLFHFHRGGWPICHPTGRLLSQRSSALISATAEILSHSKKIFRHLPTTFKKQQPVF